MAALPQVLTLPTGINRARNADSRTHRLDWETFEENIKPPTLRYEGGDVVIALSKSPDDVLLLHSSVLRASSWFGARLSGRWKTKNNIDGTSFEDRKRSEVRGFHLLPRV